MSLKNAFFHFLSSKTAFFYKNEIFVFLVQKKLLLCARVCKKNFYYVLVNTKKGEKTGNSLLVCAKKGEKTGNSLLVNTKKR